MPVVPTVTGRQVESRGVSNPGFQTVDQPNIGNAILGAGEQALNVFGKAKQQANVAMAQNASLKLSQTEEDLRTQLYGFQGQNALGKGHEFTQKYDEQIQSLSDSLPDDASRQMFMQQARLQQVQFQGSVNRYEIGQVDAFENDQISATRKLQIKNESDSWDDPQAAAVAKNIRTVAIARYGAARGWSQEQMLAEIEKDNQEATELRAKNYAVANPMGWLSGDFSADDNGVLDLRAVGIVESGGKHRNADGSLVTSPKGAQGEFQLMPETGKELAAKRGQEYNPDDPEQHAQLGKVRISGEILLG